MRPASASGWPRDLGKQQAAPTRPSLVTGSGLPTIPDMAQAPEATDLCMRDSLMDAYEHVGEIKAIKVMWEHKNTSALRACSA